MTLVCDLTSVSVMDNELYDDDSNGPPEDEVVLQSNTQSEVQLCVQRMLGQQLDTDISLEQYVNFTLNFFYNNFHLSLFLSIADCLISAVCQLDFLRYGGKYRRALFGFGVLNQSADVVMTIIFVAPFWESVLIVKF